MTGAAVAAAVAAAAGSASALTVDWADLTTVDVNQHVLGTITTAGGPVGVTYVGSRLFAEVVPGAPDQWTDNGYTEGVVNRPTGSDIIALNEGGRKLIQFSTAVTNPVVAFLNWEGVTAEFSQPFKIISNGCGKFGCGSFAPFGGNTGFFGSQHATGVLQFQGTFTELSFTDTTQNWHGFTVGLAQPGVPEPAAWGLMILGFAGAGASLRARRALTA